MLKKLLAKLQLANAYSKFIQTIVMGTTNTFLYVLAAVLLLPLIPAFLLYKFLPSRTSVSGPFKGLNLKLTGAFGGYFLLVITSIGIFFSAIKK